METELWDDLEARDEPLSAIFRHSANRGPSTYAIEYPRSSRINKIQLLDDEVFRIHALTFENEGKVYVCLKDLVCQLDIMWNMQYLKIKDQLAVGIDRYHLKRFRVPIAQNSLRVVVCLPLENLSIYLHSISFMRMVTHDKRLLLIWMQDNAQDIIEEYYGL